MRQIRDGEQLSRQRWRTRRSVNALLNCRGVRLFTTAGGRGWISAHIYTHTLMGGGGGARSHS